MQELDSPTKNRLRRNSSHLILVNQDFHQEFKNKVSRAQAKEEGEVQGQTRVFKTIHTLNTMNYEIQDSDDESTVLSPRNSPPSFATEFESFPEGSFALQVAEVQMN
jgi:hypothetical protein